MIDFHSHILPGMDDGAATTEMSLEMLQRSKLSGVELVVSTSHFYLTDNDVDGFICRRQVAYNALKTAIQTCGGSFPDIIVGAEVAYIRHIPRVKDIKKLCIEGTDYMLLELPYDEWDNDLFEDIYSLTLLGIRPVLAHLDRFMYQEKHFGDLLSLNVLCQINADSLLTSRGRKNILKLFKLDAAHILGSDMHNITNRAPNLAEGYAMLTKKFGSEYSDYLKDNSVSIIGNKTLPPPTMLPRLGFMKAMSL